MSETSSYSRPIGSPRTPSTRGAKKLKPAYLWGGAIAVVGGVYFYAKHRAANAASASAATDTTDTTDTSSDYGSDAYSEYYDSGYDAYGYGSGAYGSTPGLLGYYDPTTGQYITGTSGTTTVTAPSTNMAWTQQAVAYISSQGGDPLSALTALGVYLAGQGLSQDQYNIVQQAIAAYGYPPEPPAPPHLNPPSGQTTTGTTTGTTTTTSTGTTQTALKPGPAVTIKSQNANSVTMQWNAVAGCTHYRITRSTGLNIVDTKQTSGTVSKQTEAAYTYYVTGWDGNKQITSNSNGITVAKKASK